MTFIRQVTLVTPETFLSNVKTALFATRTTIMSYWQHSMMVTQINKRSVFSVNVMQKSL